jgi:hypothetical protein
MLMGRNVDTSDTCHSFLLIECSSALTLFVTRVGTNDTHHALAADDFAVAANFLN